MRYSDWRAMKILLFGGTGQVGRVLTRAFAGNHDVVVISRSGEAENDVRHVIWDGRTAGAWTGEVNAADVIINLAGRSVNCRYGARQRAEIMKSRLDSTRIIGESVAAASRPPKVWLNASTATIYRHALDRPMDELEGELGGNEHGAPEKWNFSIEVARAWEEAFFSCDTPGTRKVAMRSAMTMSPDRGGIFGVMRGLVRKGLGGKAGSGRQFVSWIHERDFVRAVEFLIARDDMDGPVNICSPNPLPNREFMAILRQACGMPFGLPVTRWMLEIGALFMRTETELILKSRRVVPRRLLEAGFAFEYPEWQDAAPDLCRRARGQ